MTRILLILPLLLLACSSPPNSAKVITGAEVLVNDHLPEIEDRRIGLVMNPTARINNTHMLDTLLTKGVNITALFAPEHGFRGEAGAGEVIEDGEDQATGLPVFSLYGENRKPTAEMLDEVDLLLFDMQDVGARFYTYYATLGLILEAAADHGVAVWVLDRPNPAGGEYISGWMIQEEYQSFVGPYPMPMAHGMTMGELAKMMIGEEWLDTERKPELKVIKMDGWERSMKWPDTELSWFPPSPNLPTFEHAFLYLGTVLFEGTDISEGRGTDDPFLTIGSPDTDIDAKSLDEFREKYPTIRIERTEFVPESMPGKAPEPKLEGERSSGLSLSVINYEKLDPVAFGIDLLRLVNSHTPEMELKSYLNNLSGINLTEQLDELPEYPSDDWDQQVSQFKEQRRPYLLY